MKRSFFLISCCLLSISTNLFALTPHFGVTLPILLKGKDPSSVHGIQVGLWVQPERLIWSKLSIYFAANISHWRAHEAMHYRVINIIALAPVLHYYLVRTNQISPYVELSIGPSYLSNTRFSNRNLGMHFAFQDEIGLGASFGPQQNFSIGLSALHYSNGSLCAVNAGITMPVVLNVSYRFG